MNEDRPVSTDYATCWFPLWSGTSNRMESMGDPKPATYHGIPVVGCPGGIDDGPRYYFLNPKLLHTVRVQGVVRLFRWKGRAHQNKYHRHKKRPNGRR